MLGFADTPTFLLSSREHARRRISHALFIVRLCDRNNSEVPPKRVFAWELLLIKAIISGSRQPIGSSWLPTQPDGARERRTQYRKGVRNEGVCWPSSRLLSSSSTSISFYDGREGHVAVGCKSTSRLQDMGVSACCVGFVQTVYADMCTYVAQFHTRCPS